ncbi:diphosphomevalonate decarboxylase [Dermabacter jinjuensis]|uniref:diphosphomevalonate decarboxylase n=1 Tax=Dermabacter jinjuensis TaxID=1667168 RepID=A0ABN5DXN7_9MICO|nr:diphosphomevalonate decarboxylase [Dermabacter jinjuensis]ATH96439.1 diphosphomevalonate decarboxylase [Dermabacter jinjuensis]UEB90514.1 diphosphomevalonate decarboxylase [Dermabacter jinjuensis]
MTRATAVAHPNIALVKYWGKTDRELNLPATGSLSLTLDIFPTTTTVEVTDDPFDRVVLDGVELSGEESARVRTVLSLVRELAGSEAHAHVTSTNTVPTAAGLASSAAAFAALAKASSVAYGLSLSDAELSRLARRGSGSACRSVFGGLARWNKGTSDDTSIAEPLEWSGEPLSMVVAVISSARKKIGSRAGMNHTVETSPYFEGWVSSNAVLLERASRAVHDADFTSLGEITEMSALRMHASMLGAEPPVRYLTGTSFAMIDAVQELREQGIETYASADAGPNVKILCRSREAALVAERLRERIGDVKMHVANAGPGAYLLDEGERPSEA